MLGASRRRCSTRPVRIALGLLALTAGCMTAGCTLLQPYPQPLGPENDDVSCADDLDNDDDGRFDCNDDECLGHCPEDVLTACGNGLDDDGDGLTDFGDAGCWPFARVEIEPCSSVAGGSAYLEFNPSRERWAATPGVFAADPTGRYPDARFVLTASGGSATASLDADIVGAVAGTHLSFDAYVGGDDARATVALEVSDGPVAFRELALSLEDAGLWARAIHGGQDWEVVAASFDRPAGWYHVEVTIEADDQLHVVATNEAGVMLADERGALTTHDGFGVANAFRVRIDAERFDTSVVVGQIDVERESWLPCGFVSPAPIPDWSEASVTSVLPRGDELCGVGWSRGVDTWLIRSEDHGQTWSESRASELGELMVAHGMSIDELGRSHILVGSIRDPLAPVVLATSSDCATIDERREVVLPAGWRAPFAGYRRVGDEHEIIQHTRETPDRWVLGRFADDGTLLETTDLGPAQARAYTSRLGNDVLFTTSDAAPMVSANDTYVGVIATTRRERLEVARVASIGSSHHTGACDELDPVTIPALVLDETPTVEGAAATGLLVFNCTVGYSTGTTTSGIVSNRFSVFAP